MNYEGKNSFVIDSNNPLLSQHLLMFWLSLTNQKQSEQACLYYRDGLINKDGRLQRMIDLSDE